MSISLRPLHKQVLVITGATSGIGLATAKMAVEQGAKVFMIARNEDELQEIQDEMRAKAYDTAFAVADVAEVDQLQFAADRCIDTFGRIDTWINNAGISVYGKVLDTSEEEARRLFDTNFWGVVNGSKVAVEYLKRKGGTLINIGSVLSEVSLPIQGIYSASKHAVKGFTDALRRELMAEKAPISVTLIMPSAIDTPYPEHAASHIGSPVHTAPVYAPEVVARAILRAAVKPTREVGVGSSSFLFPFMDRFFPKLQDKIMSSSAFQAKGQSRDHQGESKVDGDSGQLFQSTSEGKVHGRYPGHVMKSSLATGIHSHPWLTKGLLTGGATLLFLKKLKVF
jgi:short-subunit dehydrogenase